MEVKINMTLSIDNYKKHLDFIKNNKYKSKYKNNKDIPDFLKNNKDYPQNYYCGKCKTNLYLRNINNYLQHIKTKKHLRNILK